MTRDPRPAEERPAVSRGSLVALARSPASLALLVAALVLIWQRQHQGFQTFTWPPLRSLFLSLGLVNSGYEVLQWFCLSVLSYFVVPVLLWRFVIKRPLRNVGLRVGRWKEGLLLTAVCVALMLPVLYLTSRQADFRHYYPLFKQAATSPRLLLLHEAGQAAYFFSWEFIFRGFLLFALEESIGALAIPVQMVPFALMHLGKPWPEVYASVFAGLILGAIALRTRSILPCFLTHFLCALTLDLFVLFA